MNIFLSIFFYYSKNLKEINFKFGLKNKKSFKGMKFYFFAFIYI